MSVIEIEEIKVKLEPGQMTVVCGRPMSGKTDFALNVASKFIKEEQNVFFLAFVGDEKKLTARMISNFANQNPEMNKSDCESTVHAHFNYFETWEAVEEQMMMQSVGLNPILIIDYFQIFTSEDEKEYASYAYLKQKLKHIYAHARDYEFHTLILSQVTRDVDKRPGHFPNLHDLSDCGHLEEISDYVIALIRRELYDPNDKPGLIDFHVIKNKYAEMMTERYDYDVLTSKMKSHHSSWVVFS